MSVSRGSCNLLRQPSAHRNATQGRGGNTGRCHGFAAETPADWLCRSRMPPGRRRSPTRDSWRRRRSRPRRPQGCISRGTTASTSPRSAVTRARRRRTAGRRFRETVECRGLWRVSGPRVRPQPSAVGTRERPSAPTRARTSNGTRATSKRPRCDGESNPTVLSLRRRAAPRTPPSTKASAASRSVAERCPLHAVLGLQVPLLDFNDIACPEITKVLVPCPEESQNQKQHKNKGEVPQHCLNCRQRCCK